MYNFYLFVLLKFFLNLLYVCVPTYNSVGVAVREQLAGVVSILPPIEFGEGGGV